MARTSGDESNGGKKMPIFTPILIAAILGAYGWVWTTTQALTTMQTQAISRSDTIKRIYEEGTLLCKQAVVNRAASSKDAQFMATQLNEVKGDVKSIQAQNNQIQQQLTRLETLLTENGRE